MNKELIPTRNLVRLGRRRDWIPGRLAVWAFLLGFYDIWPIGNIIWEKS